MSDSSELIRIRVPKTIEVTVYGPQGQKVKRPYPMLELIETICDNYPPLSGTPKDARRAARLIAAFAAAKEGGIASIEPAGHDDLLEFLRKPKFRNGQSVVERSPLLPSVERGCIPYFDAIENPLNRDKAPELDEPARPARAKRQASARE